jgi:hypothetical protein
MAGEKVTGNNKKGKVGGKTFPDVKAHICNRGIRYCGSDAV